MEVHSDFFDVPCLFIWHSKAPRAYLEDENGDWQDDQLVLSQMAISFSHDLLSKKKFHS